MMKRPQKTPNSYHKGQRVVDSDGRIAVITGVESVGGIVVYSLECPENLTYKATEEALRNRFQLCNAHKVVK